MAAHPRPALAQAAGRTSLLPDATAGSHDGTRWRRWFDSARGGEPMTAAAAPTLQRIPVKPFYFNTSAHLPRITPYKASNLAELLDALRECPEDSIFHHTFRTLEEH